MPELGGDTPLETCLFEAREAGFVGIEMGRKFPRTSDELLPYLAHYGLDLVSGWYSGAVKELGVAAEIAAVNDHLNLLSAMGARVMVYCDVTGSVQGDQAMPVSQRPRLADDEWPVFGAALTEVAEHLAARGVPMAYHPHMGTIVETEAEVDRLMEVTGEAVGLLLDTGHLTYAGGDPLAVARRYGPRIIHVHCKDIRMAVLDRARTEDMSFLDAVLAGVFTVPGDGGVDFAGVLAAVKEAGYEGWLVVEAEQDPAIAHPLTYARMGHMGLTRAVLDAGM